MVSRVLGKSGVAVPPIIFGSMARHQEDDQIRIELFQRAVEIGLTCFDTAPLYDFGSAERQLGTAFNGRPDVQIFSKVGLRWDNDGFGDVHFEFRDKDGARQAVRRDSRPESVCWEVEQSLERLQKSCLDLVQIHQPDEHTPISETMSALLDLRAAGKVAHIGVSNFALAQIREAQAALGDVPLTSLQPDFSLLNRSIEEQVLPFCREQDIGVISYSPLAEGKLARAPEHLVTRLERAALENTLLPIARKHHVSQVAIAMAWVAAQPGIAAPICGASSRSQLEEIAQAMAVQLDEADLQALSAGFAPNKIQPLVLRIKSGAKRRVKKLLGRG